MSARPQRVSTPSTAAAAARESFLLECHWTDTTWTFKPTNLLEQAQPERIRWDFSLPGGARFTDPTFRTLLASSRAFIALIRTRSMNTGLGQRASTAAQYFYHLRTLVRWMHARGYHRFSDLDATALRRFHHAITARPGRTRTLAPTTVQKYLYLLVYLHRYRREVGDGLVVDPFPGQSTGVAARVRTSEIPRLPHTPDAVAIPLVQRSIEFLSNCACDLLRARELYAAVYTEVRRRGHTADVWRVGGARVLQQITLSTHRGAHPISSPAELARLLEVLYVACYIVISYLIGARASEILQLKAGCVHALSGDDPDASLAVIKGAIFKREPEFHGRPHQWVAPAPVVHAVTVLEALSAPHRERAGRPELWLRVRNQYAGATEWHPDDVRPVQVLSTAQLVVQLRHRAAWFDLPLHNGKPWRLSTHQGRKTFVRFAALRDRSALFALAQHLGHRDRGMTDAHYAGDDHVLHQEIDAAILEQSVAAWEQMLSAPHLGGRAGAEIVMRRPRFRGERAKHDLKRYARTLVTAGLTLGVCDWGFCVYRQDHSACLGSTHAPNPVRREPSTCATCRNFAIGPQHLPYWKAQVLRHGALLNEAALPRQSLAIARARLNEATTLVRALSRRGTR